jgi:hypothetical protein
MFVPMHVITEGWQKQPSITMAVHLLITNMPKNLKQWQGKPHESSLRMLANKSFM